jgi:hypothetical protein
MFRAQLAQGGVGVEAAGHIVEVIAGVGLADIGRDDRPPRAPADLVEGGVDGDAIGPGGETGTPVEAVKAADDSDERVLQGVGGVGVAARHPTADGVEPVVVAAQERVKRSPVAGSGPSDETGVVVGENAGSLLTTVRDMVSTHEQPPGSFRHNGDHRPSRS